MSRHSSARQPASINLPYTGSHGSESCHGGGDDRKAKNAATMACATSANAERAKSMSAGPCHVSVAASRPVVQELLYNSKPAGSGSTDGREEPARDMLGVGAMNLQGHRWQVLLPVQER